MLTERGWAVVGAGLALVALWVAFGEPELLAAGLIALIAGGLAYAFVWFWRPKAGLNRRLVPAQLHEGDVARVEIAVTNVGRASIRRATIEDVVGTLGSARFKVGPLRAGASATSSYRIVCRPRGVYRVGPAEVRASDPMKLAESGGTSGAVDRLTVYPAVEDLTGLPSVRGRDPATQSSKPEFASRGGEDFYTLREYRHGDDLRRVHWPSSAKKDELMIRQLETPWQSRALVLFDPRGRAYQNDDCFEKAVKGAASAVRHLFASGFQANLWIGDASVPTAGAGPYHAMMEALASVMPTPRSDLRTTAARLKSSGWGGALFLVTGVPDAETLGVQRLLASSYRSTVLMSVSQTPSAGLIQFQREGTTTVTTTPDGLWAPAWLQAVGGGKWSTASAG